MDQESIILTIKIPFQERIKIFSDPLPDDKRESRTEIQDFKRRNIKNRERMMTIHPWKNVFIDPIYTILLYMSKECLQF